MKGLSGFAPVQILSQKRFGRSRGKRLKPPEYFGVYPRIGSARIDFEASGVEWGENQKPTCKSCLSGGGVLKRWKHGVIDEKSWNGDDIFHAFGLLGTLFVSSRFYEWAQFHQFRNLVMKPDVEHSHDFYPWEENA